MYEYFVTVVDVHDGDTLTVDIDLGFRTWMRYNVRLHGLNCIELKDPGGQEAKMHLLSIAPPGRQLVLKSVAWDKFGGRIQGSLFTPQGISVTDTMIEEGFAAAWDGQGKKPTPVWPKP